MSWRTHAVFLAAIGVYFVSLDSAIARDPNIYGYTDSSEIPKLLTPEEEKIVHPILKTRVDKPLTRLLPVSDYKAFAAFSKPTYRKRLNLVGSHNLWSVGFAIAEWQALRQIQRKLIGFSKAQLLELLGPPDYSGPPLAEWNTVKKDSQVFLYEFGANRLNLIFVCRAHSKNCSKAIELNHDQFNAFQNKLALEMISFSLGKDLSSVLEKYGLSDESSYLSPNASPEVEHLTYSLGYGREVELKVRDKRIVQGWYLGDGKVLIQSDWLEKEKPAGLE